MTVGVHGAEVIILERSLLIDKVGNMELIFSMYTMIK